MEKKIILVLNNLNGGGAERVSLNLIRYLKKFENYEITLFLIKNNGVYFDEIDKDIKIIYGSKYRLAFSFPIVLIKLFFSCLGKKHLISGTECDPTYFLNLIALIQFKTPINWVHITLSEYFKKINPIHLFLTKLIYKIPSKIVCVSKGVKDDHLKLFPQKNEDIFVIYNILDNNFILQSSEIEKAKYHINSNENENHFCAVGRLSYQKGFDVLIKSVSILKPKYPNIKIKIYGMGPLHNELDNLIISLNLQKNIELMGFEKNIYQKITDSKALILPSRYEGLGMVLLEAMLLSTPVIATDCSFGPKEIIGNDEYGFLVSTVDNPIALANKIEDFMLINKSDLNSIINSASERVKDFFPEKIINKWKNILSYDEKEN